MRLVYRKKMLENRHFLIGIFQHFTTVADSAILLMVITFVYVSYANTFLLSMRKRDYATFMMFGAKSSKISQLIFVETLIIGVVATVIGAVVGVGLTAGVGNALIKMIGVSAGNFSAFYFPAIIDK